MKNNKSNILGIIGLCLSWFIPLAGIILGIISLARHEKNKVYGILAIVISIIFWIFWSSILFTFLNVASLR